MSRGQNKLYQIGEKHFMNFETKIDRRKKYYLILDCETATLPYSNKISGKEKQIISIAKPLIYDLGWKLIDRKGNVYSRKNYLITEVFSVPQVFDTAYYKDKRPIYFEKLAKGEIELVNWETAVTDLEKDLQFIDSTGAYNSMFDFKKAINFTESYITAVYSNDYAKWEAEQIKYCDYIVNNPHKQNQRTFDPLHFTLRQKEYPLFDIWGLSCVHLLNNDEYRQKCIDNQWLTASGKYYKSSAETTYRFITDNNDFIESHTALDDVEIETEIFLKILQMTKFKFEMGIIYFPFKVIGKAPITP